MPSLLIELLSEEIPARMQAKAAEDLRALMTQGLMDRGLTYGAAKAFATPRRLALALEDLPKRTPDQTEERKGPKVNAPQAALDGFLRSTGLSKDQLTIQADPKGDFYLAKIDKPGRDAPAVIAETLEQVIRNFPWPKSMRWGSGSLRWVRPLHSIICLFDGEVVAMDVDGIAAGNQTKGHRFLSSGMIAVSGFEDYAEKLEAAHVLIDRDERKQRILADAKTTAFAKGLELIDDQGLLDEVAGLVEWPVVLTGSFDAAFLAVPDEVLMTAMRAHQKYFSLRDPKTGRLANMFLVVSNMVTADHGQVIADGNGRVLRARLSDARFFWDTDLKTPLEDRLPRLTSIIFHAKLGTVAERVGRMEALAGAIAQQIGADRVAAERAARLSKADLVSETVGEFPELQGLMGSYFAAHGGEDKAVAQAIKEHYSPLGPSDHVPQALVSVAVALAEKIDTLTGFFGIDEKPTGSKDPFALRRAALGVIRIILENGLHVRLGELIDAAIEAYGKGFTVQARESLLDFIGDRLKVYLRDQGTSHDIVEAVFALGDKQNLVKTVARVSALKSFLATDDGRNLLAAFKRATNILRIEEKKDGRTYDDAVASGHLQQPEEIALYDVLKDEGPLAGAQAEAGQYEDAMAALARLRGPVDAFFEKVTVNAPEPDLRANRLCLLSEIRRALSGVADFSRIEG